MVSTMGLMFTLVEIKYNISRRSRRTKGGTVRCNPGYLLLAVYLLISSGPSTKMVVDVFVISTCSEGPAVSLQGSPTEYRKGARKAKRQRR